MSTSSSSTDAQGQPAIPRHDAGAKIDLSKSAKDQSEDLMNALTPFAKKMLKEHGEFYPYGGTMSADGAIAMDAATDGTEHPSSKALIDLMTTLHHVGAQAGKYKATCIVYDASTIPPGSNEKTDAIEVRLDHADGYSVVVVIPYRLVPGDLVTGTTYAVKGDASIFRR